MNIQELDKGKILAWRDFLLEKQAQSQLIGEFGLAISSFQVSNQHGRSLKNEVPLFFIKTIQQSRIFLLQKNYSFQLDFLLKSVQLQVKNLQCSLLFLQNVLRFRLLVTFLKWIILEGIKLEILMILLFFWQPLDYFYILLWKPNRFLHLPKIVNHLALPF